MLHDAIDSIGFGTLVTLSHNGLLASHIPMMVDKAKGDKGSIFGHVARGNLQWHETLDGSEALAIFIGPHAYISPRWYRTTRETGEVVPTWDYVAVHARGPVAFFTDVERLRAVVVATTEKYESGSKKPWRVDEAPEGYIERELKLIVGFEIRIARIEGKWKMSQNRPTADREGAARGLERRGGVWDDEVAREIRDRQPNQD